jgi:uncharacterized protein YdaU (DUF1376 family)
VNWYKFFPKDFQFKTAHLDHIENLTYRLLLDEMYITERPIALDLKPLARRLRMTEEVIASVLGEFFQQTEAGWVNQRVEEEMGAYRATCERQSQNASKRWNKSNAMALPRDATALPLDANRSRSRRIDIVESNGKVERFFEFWATWPAGKRKVGKHEALRIWQRDACEEIAQRIMEHLKVMKLTEQWRTGFEPMPATYLGQKRYFDEIQPDGQMIQERRAL